MIEMFINSMQNEAFSINDKNVFSLHQLSMIYEVPSLKHFTEEYINEHNIDLVLKSILHKQKLIEKCNETFMISTKEEEETVALNFNKYIKNDDLIKLPILVLYRIFNHPNMNINKTFFFSQKFQ